MNTEISRKEFYQGAMSNGTILGVAWSIMYLSLFAGTTNMFFLSLSMALFISSPFMAAKLAIIFRKKSCGDAMSYIQAWIFTFYMYISATLLSTLVTYIYFHFIDGGSFVMTLKGMFDEAIRVAGSDKLLTEQLEQTRTMLENTATSNFVWQLMNNNLMNATILPLIIAFFVKRKI